MNDYSTCEPGLLHKLNRSSGSYLKSAPPHPPQIGSTDAAETSAGPTHPMPWK